MTQQCKRSFPRHPIREFATNKTMYETIRTANQGNPDFDAIGYMGRSIKYKELLNRVDRLAAAFQMQGVKEGDVVPICVINTPEVAEILKAPILNGYGCNEVLGGASVNPYSKNRHGTVGLPLGNNLIKAFDTTTQEPLPDNIQGEICIKTDTAFKEYVNNPSATEEVKRTHADGTVWIHTGDIGFTDKDGYVYIVGRLKRAIIRAAFKIFPGTIEDVISLHPVVKECVVVGVADVNEGHVPMAHVVVKDEYSYFLQDIEKQLREMCQKHLKDYEQPKYFNFLESIPYTANNKQDFRVLEEIGGRITKNL